MADDSYSITYQPNRDKTVHDIGGVYRMLDMSKDRLAGMCAGALVLFGRHHAQHVRINRFGLLQDPLGILDPDAEYSQVGGTVGATGSTPKKYTCKLTGPVWTLLVKFNSIDFLLGFANLCTGMFHTPYAALVSDLLENGRSWEPRTLLEVWYNERRGQTKARFSSTKVKDLLPS